VATAFLAPTSASVSIHSNHWTQNFDQPNSSVTAITILWMEHNSSVVMWWPPHNSSSIQQTLLSITAVQVTTLWLYWSIIQSCTTVNKYTDASEHNEDVPLNDYHSVVCHEIPLLLFQRF
jgi:hypothetical protein